MRRSARQLCIFPCNGPPPLNRAARSSAENLLPLNFASPAGAAIYTIWASFEALGLRYPRTRSASGAGCGIASILFNNQLIKLCALRIAAAQHYCFSSGRRSLFSARTICPAKRPDRKKEVLPMFATFVRFFREWHRYNQSLRELSALGDRELADIGISRSDIQRVAWNATHHG
jgi:uncharacterized protein YjiS (DUF1127 family)